MKYVIIGNGVAGINAALEIRRADKKASVVIISKESDYFFSRTGLMYALSGQLSLRNLEPLERDQFNQLNLELVRAEVVGLNHEDKIVKIATGETIVYDRLLIASGSVAAMAGWPGRDLTGVSNFVTLEDFKKLRKAMANAKRACVVGGGLIGIEVAEVLLKAGIKVSFLIREKHLWPIALDINEAGTIVKHMRHHNCDVRLGTECQEIIGSNGVVSGLLTTDGEEIPCELVVFAIGVKPQTGWMDDCGIERDKGGGIVVDEHLRTNIEDVFAAGDCTSVVWFNGVRRPEQLWYTSRDQGKVAGRNMAGATDPYRRATFYNSAKFFDLEYTTAGYVNFGFDGEQNWYQHEPGTTCSERITYLADQTVVGFNMLGRRWDHRLLVDWVDRKRKLDWVIEHLHEAIFDEEFMPGFKLLSS